MPGYPRLRITRTVPKSWSLPSAMTERTTVIRARIRRYERSLRKELSDRGFIHDGYGKRYLLGPMYLQLGDVEGALDSFAWFQHTFPDDIGEPFQFLFWALALFRAGKLATAKKKLVQTMLMNLYLVPHLLHLEIPELDVWHCQNVEYPEYVEYLPAELEGLWDEEALAWVKSVYKDPKVQEILQKFISIVFWHIPKSKDLTQPKNIHIILIWTHAE